MSTVHRPASIELVSDGLTLEVLTAGAAVRRLVVQDGHSDGPVDVVLGHRDAGTYATGGGYLGAVVGRYANRIAGGRFALDGTTYSLTTNEGPNTLHGGADGFDRRVWTVEDAATDHVRLRLTSPDGDQGFPGRLDAEVTYSIGPRTVRLDYTATTDRATVVNLTNHAYVNLDGEGSGSVDDHVLRVEADTVAPVRPDLLPTGLAPVTGTPLDWRSPRRIGTVLQHDHEQLRRARGLDHHFVVRGSGMRTAAVLTGRSGRTLTVESDQPGVQVYTGGHFDETIIGLSGRRYGPRAGIALETQGFPDAPNRPDLPSTVLRPGEVFRSTTVWRLS
ncbi:aldose epimerase family protein [Intrasporangium flavum]|uniref:aldose epimerase family protein n=1 Tax=Intrasporangium flavum TaxID=1428657 RepID=UPI00096D1124|nr:aldose epimerase family protein [Intrasporangium flavum]